MTLGRHGEALDDLRRAVAILRRAGDSVWEARALTYRALTHLALGVAESAYADFDRAERLLTAAGQELESAYAVHNRGLVAFRTGDLPAALSHLDEAARRYRTLNVLVPDLIIDRCAVLLTAGLAHDAVREADAGINDLEEMRGRVLKRAELLLTAANSALAAGDPQTAFDRASTARRLFGGQRREWWHAHAGLTSLRARYAAGAVSVRLLANAERTAARLEFLASVEAGQAHLLAGRVALDLGRSLVAHRHLAAAARARRRGPALSRASGWLAAALTAEAAGDPRWLFHACRRGLAVIDEHLLTLGASELRAQATAQGAELAALAQRHALRSGRPRLLLSWSERWRATALAVPPVRPQDDERLRADLTAVRDVTSRLDKARAEGLPTAALRREQIRQETAVRARVLQTRGTGDGGASGFDVDELLAELGDARLVQLVDVDGHLHPLVCGAGKVRHFAGGTTRDAAREIDFARFGLTRLARGRPAGGPAGALAILEATGRSLEDRLLGPAAGSLGEGPIVIVPPGRLHAVPWALLPSLRGRVFSVAPSARAWIRARHVRVPSRLRIALVRGPDLGVGISEAAHLANDYDDAVVLGDGTATAARVLEAIDGAWLAHIAAHGTFRADSPLFSSLRMDDGPLTVYDFERLRRAPYRLILPSCDSGRLATAGADELLGLTSSLLPLGTAEIAASPVLVNDQAAVQLMRSLHQRLRSGRTIAESLCDIRAALADDPILLATSWSFAPLGAGF
jgi:tetratricopeptide (TPR) repeat protein